MPNNEDINNSPKKLIYKIKLFNMLKILGGAIEIIKEGIVVHLTKRKATIFEFKDIFNIGKKFKPLKDYHFIKFNTKLKIGIQNNDIIALQTAFIYSFVNNICNFIIKNYKPYLNFKNDVYVYEDKNIFEFNGEIIVLFNILMVLISIIKIGGEKLIYAIKKRA